jgi:hypothetical protein
MVGYWNVDCKKEVFLFNIIEFNTKKNSAIRPNPHFPRTHYSSIPIVSEAN